MISILKTALEMERLAKFQKAAIECYGLSITSTEQNAIEFDEEETSRFRGELRALAGQLGEATTPEQLHRIQGSFGDELRDFKDATTEQIRRLRREVEAASSALDQFAGNALVSGDDHEKELKRALDRLNAAAMSPRIEDIQSAIRKASVGILASFEQMRAINQLAVAQLKDEIRILHQRVHAGTRVAVPERVSETWNRQEIDDRIDGLLNQNVSFCLILIVLRNLRALASRHSTTVMDEAIQSLQARLHGMPGAPSVLGRWTKNQFVAILDVPPGRAMSISHEVAQRLSEPYSFQENGAQRTLSFHVAAGMVDHRTGANVMKFRAGLEKLSVALGGAQL